MEGGACMPLDRCDRCCDVQLVIPPPSVSWSETCGQVRFSCGGTGELLTVNCRDAQGQSSPVSAVLHDQRDRESMSHTIKTLEEPMCDGYLDQKCPHCNRRVHVWKRYGAP